MPPAQHKKDVTTSASNLESFSMSIIFSEETSSLQDSPQGLPRSRSFDSITSIASSLSDFEAFPTDITEEEVPSHTSTLPRTQSAFDNRSVDFSSEGEKQVANARPPMSAKEHRRLRRASHNFHVGLLTHNETTRTRRPPRSLSNPSAEPVTPVHHVESTALPAVPRPADAVWDVLLQ